MRVKIIANPAAGQAEPVLAVLNSVFAPADIGWDVAITHAAGDAATFTREAIDLGFDLVGVYGGDGTVSEVAEALVGGDVPMLLLPGGTGNVLAGELGVPFDLDKAASLALEGAGRTRRVDLGRACGTMFTTRLTMGLEAQLVGEATREMKDRFGWLAYAFAGVQAIANPPTATYRLTVDGDVIECAGVAAIVANSASTGVGNMRLADEVDVSDGLLDLVVLQQTDLLGMLGSAADLAQGQQPRVMSRWKGRTIRVESDPAQSVVIDGETTELTTPIEAVVQPGAFEVIVPREA